MPARPAVRVLAILTALTATLFSPMAVQASPVTAAAAGKSSVSIMTFNVCGHAAGCRGWGKREAAIVQRIVRSKADVVNVQEVWGVLDRLEQRLTGHGYVLAATSGNEGVFAKSSKLAPVVTTQDVTTCRYGRIFTDPSVNTQEWDTSGPHVDDSGVTWFPDRRRGLWYRMGETCTTEAVTTAKAGQISMGGRASAAWALLQVKKTKKTYLFVSAHLTTGKDKVAGKRRTETSRLLAATKQVAEGHRRVFAGDFNSSIQRGKDTVGRTFTADGFADSYTKAKSRAGAKYNSASGWGTKPHVGGSHIDRVFLPRGATATKWALDARARRVGTIASDHSSVRVSVVLP